MISGKKEFYGGLTLLIVFFVILVIVFSPIFNGKNGLEYMDNLYNCISKGSAYYIPKMKSEADTLKGSKVNLIFNMHDKERARQVADQFIKGGFQAKASDEKISVSGDLGAMLAQILADSDRMYYNKGSELSKNYELPEKEALYNWWIALVGMDKDLKAKQKFAEATIVDAIRKKAVETSFNYYGITPQKISDRVFVVIFSLIFYVVYTIWYGFAILFIMEGWGLRLEH